MLFQRAAGEAEESRGFGRAQVARRQAGVRIGHLRGSVISWSAGEVRRRVGGHDGGAGRAKGDADDEGVRFSAPPLRQIVSYFLRRAWRSSVAIAAAHQRKAALHKADGAVAQVMGFPGPIRECGLSPNKTSAIAR